MIFRILWARMMKHPQGSAQSRRWSRVIAIHLTPWDKRAGLTYMRI